MDFALRHTSRCDNVTPHVGFCATDCNYAGYGRHAYRVELAGDLVIRKVVVTREQRDANEWPGDTAAECAAYAADGVDVIQYADEDESGHQHDTWRLVSERAVSATTLTLIDEE